MPTAGPDSGRRTPHSALIFVLLFLALLAIHAPLLRLPYFWDEAGYYVPAGRDLLLTGSLIPHSTPSNAHPPLVMAYLALCWKIAGFTPMATHAAMLLVAAFALLGLFRLAQRTANTQVAIATVVCTAAYPVFFVQSSVAQVDLAAAGLTFWGLLAYTEHRFGPAAFWFSLAGLAKETAILAPLALLCWEVLRLALRNEKEGQDGATVPRRLTLLLTPLAPLACWYAYHRWRTGFFFGNPEFFRYNVQATMHPLRIALAFLMRMWQAFGYMGLYVLTLAAMAAMWLPPRREAHSETERPRIALSVQFAFLAVIAVYVSAMSAIGGAVLARYMLPAVPLVILICISTLRRRVAFWPWVVAVVALAFVTSLFVNPPYGFPFEDNLAYRDYIRLHQGAVEYVEAHHPGAHVLTAWPASGELSQPWLGYVSRPVRVVQIENFTPEQLMSATEVRPEFDLALVFSTKYEPPHPLLPHWPAWERIKMDYFGYHRDVPPQTAAQILGGKLVYVRYRKGQWVGVIEMENIEEARGRETIRSSDGRSAFSLPARHPAPAEGAGRPARPE